MALEKQSCIINPGHQGGKNRFTTRLNPMEPLQPGLGSNKKNKTTQNQQLHCKTWDKSWQKRSFSTWGKAGNFSRTVGKEEQHLMLGCCWALELQVRQQPPLKTKGKFPKNCRENPPKPRGNPPKLQGKTPKTAGEILPSC